MSIIKDLFFRRKKLQFLKNSTYYFKLLKNSEDNEISLYKLEIAKILNDVDIFFLKVRLILSIGGIIVSVLLFGIITEKFLRYGFYGPESVIYSLYLYFLFFIMLISYKSYKIILKDLEFLAEFIEE